MSLTNTINNTITRCFETLGDINTEFTLSVLEKTYNANTCTTSSTFSNTVFTSGVIKSFTDKEIMNGAGSIKVTDKKLVFPNADQVSFKVGDKISIGSDIYNIENNIEKKFIMETIQLRKP